MGSSEKTHSFGLNFRISDIHSAIITKQRENLHYLGYLPPEKTIPLLRGSDLLIHPSLIEGISSTILEAMACKTAIIATDIGGNKEILTNEKTAILVKNHNDIISSILKLFENSKTRQTLVDNAFQEVQKYDWSVIGKQYFQLYSSLL